MAEIVIPKKHKAAIYDKPGSISTKVVEVDTPEPGPGDILVNLYVLPLAELTVVCQGCECRSC